LLLAACETGTISAAPGRTFQVAALKAPVPHFSLDYITRWPREHNTVRKDIFANAIVRLRYED